jgi:DNA polymerase-1
MLMYDSVIIDSMMMAYKSWWPVRDFKTSTGVHSGLEFGFMKNLLYVTREFTPAKVVLAWDGRPTKGLDLASDYKANRNKDMKSEEPPWGPRLSLVMDLLADVTLSLYHPETEADEQIARWVKQEEEAGRKTLIVSADKDLHQLTSSSTHVKTKEKSEDIILDGGKVRAIWGVIPERIPLIRAISGDTSDNIKGVPRIAAGTKIRLATEASTPTVEALIEKINSADYLSAREKEKLVEGRDLIIRNHKMMALRGQTEPPTVLKPPTGDTTKVLEFCRLMELNSLVNRGEWRLFSGAKS